MCVCVCVCVCVSVFVCVTVCAGGGSATCAADTHTQQHSNPLTPKYYNATNLPAAGARTEGAGTCTRTGRARQPSRPLTARSSSELSSSELLPPDSSPSDAEAEKLCTHTHTQVRARARLRACGVACTTVSYLTEERSDGSWHVPVATLQCERTARGTLRGPSRPAGARGGAPPPNTSERSPRRRSPRFAARSRLAGIRPKLFPANSTRALASGGMVGMMAACLCRS